VGGSHNAKDRFYEEFERVFDKFHEYLMKIMLGDFLPGREDFLNRQLGMKVYTKLVMTMGIE
jgi:hypothetical protein